MNDLLRIIDDKYVDTVNMTDLVESAMPRILAELDPHSAYLSAKMAEASEESLRGSFSGIGVSFTMQDDTARIISVIKGGPSEKVGLLAGDRIISVDGKPITGKDVTAEDCQKLMKGEKGTNVRLGIRRMGEEKTLFYTVTRGDIPVHSIEATYMLTPETGYIKINAFSETTYPELLVALAELNQQGFKDLVIDLRGNTGGIMQTAIQMANIYSDILTGTMDAFASVIGNNMNIIMKRLTVISLSLMFPTFITGFFGMNIHIPGMESRWAWLILVFVCAAVALVGSYIISDRRNKLLLKANWESRSKKKSPSERKYLARKRQVLKGEDKD